MSQAEKAYALIVGAGLLITCAVGWAARSIYKAERANPEPQSPELIPWDEDEGKYRHAFADERAIGISPAVIRGLVGNAQYPPRAERTPEQAAPGRIDRDGLTRTRDEQTALDNISTRARRERLGYGESVRDYINRNARIDMGSDTEGDDK